MSDTKIKELSADIEELNLLLKQATRKKVQDALSIEIRKFETEVTNIKESSAAEAVTKPSTSSVKADKQRYQVKLNGYGWDQSEKYIKVFVTLKDAHKVPKDQVYCNLTEKSLELHIDDLDNKDYVLVINNLLETINVADSHWKQKTDMVVVFLAKSYPSHWAYMTEIDKKCQDHRASKLKPPQDGGDLKSLFQNMYETGDDEMKRMIAKAWHEGQQKNSNVQL